MVCLARCPVSSHVFILCSDETINSKAPDRTRICPRPGTSGPPRRRPRTARSPSSGWRCCGCAATAPSSPRSRRATPAESAAGACSCRRRGCSSPRTAPPPGEIGPIRGEDCGHVTRPPPITAHLGAARVEEVLAAVESVDGVIAPEPLPGPGHGRNNNI